MTGADPTSRTPRRQAVVAGAIALVVVLAACLLALRVESPFVVGTVGSMLGGVPGTLRPTPPPRGFRGPIRQGNVRPPRKIVHVDPIWPEAARACDLRGVVIVEMTVGTTGLVESAHILRSMPGLDEAALDAVRQWVFEPTRMNGELYSIVVAMTVTFPPAAPPVSARPGDSPPAAAESDARLERLRLELEVRRRELARLAVDVDRLNRLTIDAPRSRTEPLRTRVLTLQTEIAEIERQLGLFEEAARIRQAAAAVGVP